MVVGPREFLLPRPDNLRIELFFDWGGLAGAAELSEYEQKVIEAKAEFLKCQRSLQTARDALFDGGFPHPLEVSDLIDDFVKLNDQSLDALFHYLGFVDQVLRLPRQEALLLLLEMEREEKRLWESLESMARWVDGIEKLRLGASELIPELNQLKRLFRRKREYFVRSVRLGTSEDGSTFSFDDSKTALQRFPAKKHFMEFLSGSSRSTFLARAPYNTIEEWIRVAHSFVSGSFNAIVRDSFQSPVVSEVRTARQGWQVVGSPAFGIYKVEEFADPELVQAFEFFDKAQEGKGELSFNPGIISKRGFIGQSSLGSHQLLLKIRAIQTSKGENYDIFWNLNQNVEYQNLAGSMRRGEFIGEVLTKYGFEVSGSFYRRVAQRRVRAQELLETLSALLFVTVNLRDMDLHHYWGNSSFKEVSVSLFNIWYLHTLCRQVRCKVLPKEIPDLNSHMEWVQLAQKWILEDPYLRDFKKMREPSILAVLALARHSYEIFPEGLIDSSEIVLQYQRLLEAISENPEHENQIILDSIKAEISFANRDKRINKKPLLWTRQEVIEFLDKAVGKIIGNPVVPLKYSLWNL